MRHCCFHITTNFYRAETSASLVFAPYRKSLNHDVKVFWIECKYCGISDWKDVLTFFRLCKNFADTKAFADILCTQIVVNGSMILSNCLLRTVRMRSSCFLWSWKLTISDLTFACSDFQLLAALTRRESKVVLRWEVHVYYAGRGATCHKAVVPGVIIPYLTISSK